MDGWMDEKDHQFEKRINNTIYTFTAIPIAPHPWEPDSILSFGLLPPLSYSLSLSWHCALLPLGRSLFFFLTRVTHMRSFYI